MKKIPILFIKDDETLIEMYREYLELRGYRSIIIKGGEKELKRAIIEGPALVTFDINTLTQGNEKVRSLIIIFTYTCSAHGDERPEVTSAVISSDVFEKIEKSFG